MKILIWKDEQQLGPFTEHEIREHLRSGKFSESELAWAEGQSDWKPLGEILIVESGPPPLHGEPRTKSPTERVGVAASSAKLFLRSVLAKAIVTARLTQKQAGRTKLEFVDLRKADYRTGNKAYESGSSLLTFGEIVSQLNDLRQRIETLHKEEAGSYEHSSFKEKAKAAANRVARVARIKALTLEQRLLLTKLGSQLRVHPTSSSPLSAEIESASAVTEVIKRLDDEIERLASATYGWARRPLLVLSILFLMVVLLQGFGIVSGLYKRAAHRSEPSPSAQTVSHGSVIDWLSGKALSTAISAPSGSDPARASKDPPLELIAEENQLESSLLQRTLTQLNGFTSEKAKASTEIRMAREKFWALYPDKQGVAQARGEFSSYLLQKDLYFLNVCFFSNGEQMGWSEALDKFTPGGSLDGGIRPAAKPEFGLWVEAIRNHFKAHKWSNLSDLASAPARFAEAMAACRQQYDNYVVERDWAEFDSAGREPAGVNDPRVYGVMLCKRFETLSTAEAVAQYASMERVLGSDKVRQAIQKVHTATKDKHGFLANPEEIGLTWQKMSFIIGPSGTEIEDETVLAPEGAILFSGGRPLEGAVALAMANGPREYALGLMAPLSPGMHAKVQWDSGHGKGDIYLSHDWNFAEGCYQRWVAAFGEAAVLKAADKVRRARKRLWGGYVADCKALGAGLVNSYDTPYNAFRVLLASGDPKGYARAILYFHDFPARWTFGKAYPAPSQVDSAYKKLASSYGEEAVANAAGALAGEDSAVTDRFDAFQSMLTVKVSSKVRPIVQVMTDNPDYLSWSGFKPGAKANYLSSNWEQRKEEKALSYPYRLETKALRSITDECALLWDTGTSIFQGSQNPSRDEELRYYRKIPAQLASPPKVVDSGVETLSIKGQNIWCRWTTTKGSSGPITVWTSDRVPGGLVRRLEKWENWRADSYFELLLQSFEGSRDSAAEVLPSSEEKPSGWLEITSPAIRRSK